MDETKPDALGAAPASAPTGIMAQLDAVLPRLWKTWLITALVVVAVLLIVGSAWDRAGVMIAKVPLLTIGGLIAYYLDRGIFPYARPDIFKKAFDDLAALPMTSASAIAWAVAAFAYVGAQLRRAIIIAAGVLAAALAA